MLDLVVSDLLRFAHLLAVAAGLGVAIETEAYLVRRRRSAIGPGLLAALEHRHRVILAALGAMWVTGLALVALRTGFSLAAFTPKLWAKITVVTILTANAVFVAEVALPILARHEGRRIGALPEARKRALFAVAGVSAASWIIALALGASSLLRVAPAPLFQVVLPLAYGAGLLAAALVGRRLFPAPLAAPAGHARAGVSDRPRAATPDRAVSGISPTHHGAAAPEAKARSTTQVSSAPATPATKARRLPPAPAVELRASDLAIAFPRRPSPGPRLRPEPEESAARTRLADAAADLGLRR